MGWWSPPSKVSAADVYAALTAIGERVDEVLTLSRANAARLNLVEKIMAWSTADVERANAVTTRLAAAFRAQNDENRQLRTQLAGLTASVDAEQALSEQQADALVGQLEALFADGSNPVPSPPAGGVSDAPGGEVPAVVSPEQATAPAEGPSTAAPAPGTAAPLTGVPIDQPPGGSTAVDNTPAEGALAGELGDGQVSLPSDAASPAGPPAAEGAGSTPDSAPTELADGQTNL